MGIWFTEQDGDGLRVSFKVRDVLFSGKSEFQKVEVIESVDFGKILLLDGLVMCTEMDEFVYHEMISHVSVLAHGGQVSKVLVIGGGDGGTVRELLKHQTITEIVLCEIDGLVISTAKKYFPKLAGGLEDERVTVRTEDGVDFLKRQPDSSFDLIIVDSTDPIGPGEVLFSKEFYAQVSRVVGSGVMVCQSESPWYEGKMLKQIQENVGGVFDQTLSYVAAIPTYPRGYWSFTMASHRNLKTSAPDPEIFAQLEPLHYLNREMFSACFALPNFYRRKLGLS